MTSRLRRKHRTTVRIRQRKSRTNRLAKGAGWLLAFAILALGTPTQDSQAQQSSIRTVSPPVHIAPGQSSAVQRYSGIAAPHGHVPERNQTNLRNQFGANPAPTNASQPQRNPRSPQLQARIARALNGITGRGAAKQPTPVRNQQAQPMNVNRPIGSGLQPNAQSFAHRNGSATRNAYQNQVRPEFRQGYQPAPPRTQRNRVQPQYVVQQPPLDLPTSRQNGRELNVTQIQATASTPEPYTQTQPIESSTPYYDRPDIQMTSAQELDNEILIHEEPDVRMAQAPLYQDFDSQVPDNPVSVLNRVPSQPANFSGNGYQEGDFQPQGNQDLPAQDPEFNAQPATGNQLNDLRIQNPQDDQAEVIQSTEDDDDIQRRSFDRSCDVIRNELLGSSIADIALDMSPPKSKNPPNYRPQVRTWTDQFGRVVGTGAIVSLEQGYVIIENNGVKHRVAYGNLSDPDLEVVAQFWQIPKECTVSQDIFAGRSWMPQTLTWKASNLCHKPLYFENVQLERYGHSNGPFSQPFHSTFHFFRSLVFLPYNTGINPPNECRYALGYYRPGNCAPWLVDPVPFSLAGLRHQTNAMVGGAFLIIP